MLWNRAKTILIVVFFFINLFLLNFLLADRHQDNSQVIGDLTAVLSKNEIHLQVDNLPRVEQEMKVPELAPLVIDETLAKKLISKPVFKNDGYTAQDGSSRLESENGIFFFRDASPDLGSFRGIQIENAAAKIQPYLDDLGVGQYVYAIDAFQIEDDVVVEYAYRIGNYKLFDSHFSVTVTKDGVKQIKGFLGTPDQENGFSYQLSQLETVLLSMAQNHLRGIEITNIELGYYLINYQDALVSQAIPAYRLRTSWGEYILDARDGVEYTQRVLSGDLKEGDYEEVSVD